LVSIGDIFGARTVEQNSKGIIELEFAWPQGFERRICTYSRAKISQQRGQHMPANRCHFQHVQAEIWMGEKKTAD
jgi:hypothetical protein